MTVDQLLFGYDDGHGLLAGSRTLSPKQLRDVLPHIDASFERPDERELVGIWIPSLEGYMLAQIWAAPERPRAGAVWAHAVLLSADQLRRDNLTSLLRLLQRPSDRRREDYEKPLAYPPAQELILPAGPLTRAVVWAGLDAANRPGVVLWDEPPEAENALVALLAVMPAAARTQFSFRTRTRARLGVASYGLQVAAVLGGTPADADELVIDARQPPPKTPPAWTILLEDSPAAARLRDFVHRYGSEHARDGAQASALATVACMLDAGAEPQRIIRRLIQAFPRPDEVPELRLSLLGTVHGGDGLWQIGEEQRLALLCDHATHFDIIGLELEQRISSLAQTHPEAALRIVERARRSGRPAAA